SQSGVRARRRAEGSPRSDGRDDPGRLRTDASRLQSPPLHFECTPFWSAIEIEYASRGSSVCDAGTDQLRGTCTCAPGRIETGTSTRGHGLPSCSPLELHASLRRKPLARTTCLPSSIHPSHCRHL